MASEISREKELRQLHNRKAQIPIRKDIMSFFEQKKVLRYLLFLKEKRHGMIKAWMCTWQDLKGLHDKRRSKFSNSIPRGNDASMQLMPNSINTW